MTVSPESLNQAEALQQAAALAKKSDNLERALETLDQAIALSPQESRNHFLRGLTLEDLHRPDEASRCKFPRCNPSQAGLSRRL